MEWLAHNTVAAVIERDGNFLMVEETASDGRPVINQPAGHLEAGESLIQAVIRETREETAWRFTPEGLVGIYRWQVPPDGTTYLRFCFHGRCHDQDPDQALDRDILRTLWLSREQLAAGDPGRLRSPMVLRCIDDFLAGPGYPLSLLHDLV